MEEDKDIMFKISYTYHGGKRTTPVFIKRDTLLNSTFEQFADILKHEIRYISDLGKIRITYRDEDGVDIDLTEERFQWQMRDAMKFSEKLSMNVIEGESPASPVQSVIPKRFKRDTCQTFTQPKRLNFLPTAPVTTTPLDDFLTSKDTEISALKQELNTHKNQYDNLVGKYGRKPFIDYSRQMCGFCHYCPQNKNDRCHNRANCPNEEKCNSAEICGDLEKHDDEKRIVNKLKTKIEKLEKKIKFASQEYDLRKGYVEKTIEEGIRERLLLEVPERYYCIRGGNVNYTLLNLDVNIIVQYCRKSRITSPSAIKDLRSILSSLHQESGAFSAYNFGRRDQADQVNKAYQSASYEARIPGLRRLWEMKGTEYPQFENQSCFTGTCTVTGPKSDGTPSMLQWLAPSTVEELGLYHSTMIIKTPTCSKALCLKIHLKLISRKTLKQMQSKAC